MVKLPRDIRPRDPRHLLETLGFVVVRQTGSHVRMTHPGPPQCHVVIPDHKPLKVGTLHAILAVVSVHLRIEEAELAKRL